VDALKREMTARRDFLAAGRLDTIYVGGGTPTTLSPVELRGLLDHAAGLWDCSGLREVTLEANPEDLTADYLARLSQEDSSRSLRSVRKDSECHPDRDRRSTRELSIKFNRLSIGIQSFDDGLLRMMNRRHTAARAIEAVRNAQRAGFDNISIDLIWGIPGMTPAQWEYSLDQAIDLGVQHISAYHLTIEPGTAFGRSRLQPIADEESERQFATLRQKLGEAGFEHYEISNFALPGRRAVHNSAYWSGEVYLGVGPSAHSFDGNRRREWVDPNVEKYAGVFSPSLRGHSPEAIQRTQADWIALSPSAPRNDASTTIYGGETLTDIDIRNERIMTGLRTAEGVACGELRMVVEKLIAEGLLVRRGDRLIIPPEKYLLSDLIIAQLFE
jgi:oxygen-independent coproporphyrinogen-3 oxidase